jgi:two-component system response regulator RegX3
VTDRSAAAETLRNAFTDHELEWKEIEDGVFTVVLPGEKKLQTPCRFDVGTHALGVHAFVARHPDENHERVYRWLLEMLLRNPGRVLTRGQLIDRVWGSDYVGDTKTLDVHVKRLRAKIEPDPAQPKYLVTVRGLGYKLDL